jgi:CBS domain-containing protein
MAVGDIELLRQAWDAFARGDVDAATDVLDPEVRWFGVDAEAPEDGCHNRDQMEAAPSTIRADAALTPLAERMRKQTLTSLPVTTPDGELFGVVRREDIEALLAPASS